MTTQQEHQLKRGLKNRHIQLIALGGAVGTGLFLGIAQTIRMAGPSVLLGYAIAGVIAFFIMRQLGEMVVEEPVAGSFSHFANRYWGPFAGVLSGRNERVCDGLVSMAGRGGGGGRVLMWGPEVPTWLTAAFFFVAINAINLTHVKVYGELEFWFSIVKVAAIISMIAFGCYLLFSGHGGPAATVANLWQDGGFFPNGITGLVMAMVVIMFSFGGLELVGITAAEADEPHKTIPKATNQVIYRILLFYVGSLAVLLSLYPWRNGVGRGSPFLLGFHALYSKIGAQAAHLGG
ncbi:amino acid permease, partial [Klebsiella pneumoniae]|nr:amino acid permease [Klebsiella pneumoniae]